MERDNYVYLSWQDLPIFLSLITLLLSFMFLIRKSFFRTKPVNLPPSPPRLPIIGNLHQIGEHVDRSLRDLSQKYGPLMLLHFGSVPTVVVSSPDMVKEIAKNHDVLFSDRFNTRASDVLFYGGKDIVFASYGNNWRQARKLCVQEMLSSKRVLSFQSIREEEVSSLVSKIRQVCLNGDDGAVNMCEMLIRTSNNIMSSQVFEERKAMKASENGVKDFVDILLQLQKDNMFNMDLTDERLRAIVQGKE
uniref:Cytochrome P450 n=1 Tax=Cannabis sativa TaxID=3483 RepID=A0A803PIM1_CANSA